MKQNLFFRGRKYLLLAGMLALSIAGISQNPSVRVFEDWNSSASSIQADFQRAIVRSKTVGGSTFYYTCGSSLNSSGNYDIFIQKKSSTGTVLWTQVYAGVGNGNDYGADVQITAGGSVYVCGSYYKNSTDSNNAVIIKYNNAGTQQWVYSYNGTGSRHDAFTAMQLSASAIVAVGTTYQGSTNLYDMLAARVDTNGNSVWLSTFDYINLNDGAVNLWNSGTKVYIAGGAQSATTTYKYAVWNVKFSDGTTQGSTVTGGTAFGFDQLTDLNFDLNGNIYVTGGVLDATTGYDIKTVKLDSTLTILWSQTYTSTGSNTDMGTGLTVDQAGNVIVTGYRTTSTTGKDYVTIKYSSGGTQRWVSTFDGGTNQSDSATCVVVSPTDTNKIYVSGYSYNVSSKDYWTLKYDGAGNLQWNVGFNHVKNGDDRAMAIAIDSNGDLVVEGQNKINDSTYEYTTVKYVEKAVTLPQDTLSFTYTNYKFTQNRGQVIHLDSTDASEVKFYTIFEYPAMYFTDTSAIYVQFKNDTSVANNDSASRVDMKFVGSNSNQKIRPLDKRDEYYNFFAPQCPQGRGKVPNYDRLISMNVWNGVDIVYGSNLEGLKYYFVCKPVGGGSSAPSIDLYYEGADSVKVGASGELIIYTPLGNIVQPKAAAWQLDASGNYSSLGWQPTYTILGTNEVGFTSFGSFNSALPIVIAVDRGNTAFIPPTNWNENNVWSTFMKGDQPVDIGLGSTMRQNGDLLITGTTMGGLNEIFPTTPNAWDGSFNGLQDVFVTDFDSNNDMVWSTFIGGYSDEVGYDVKERLSSNIILFGNTSSDNFPMYTPGSAYQVNVNVAGDYDYYLCELTFAGDFILWSTYFGGDDREFVNWGRHLDIDASDNMYISGYTESNATTEGFPIHTLTGAYNQTTFGGGGGDGFVAKFSAGRTLVWSTFYGGNNYDQVDALQVDGSDIYISGTTATTSTNTTCSANTSGGFPICNGGYYQSAHQGGGNDGFIARFNSSCALTWSTFYGGNGYESHVLLSSANGKVYLVGSTATSTGQTSLNQCSPSTTGAFPTCDPGGGATFNNSNAGGNDIFIAEFNSSNQLQWSTFYGGTGNETPNCTTIDGSGNLFIGGLVNGGFSSVAVNHGNNYYWQQYNADGSGSTTDGLIIEIDPSRVVTWATHYGGHSSTSTFNPEEINSITAYQSSGLFITGVAGSTNFPYRCDPNTAYCWQENNSGYLESVFVAKFDLTGGVGINEPDATNNSFALYPNPATNQLNVTLDGNITEGSTFTIYNSIGQVIYTRNLSAADQNRNFSIDVSLMASGFYVARLETSDGTSSKEFIKQ